MVVVSWHSLSPLSFWSRIIPDTTRAAQNPPEKDTRAAAAHKKEMGAAPLLRKIIQKIPSHRTPLGGGGEELRKEVNSEYTRGTAQ